jgi:hypothetical protein
MKSVKVSKLVILPTASAPRLSVYEVVEFGKRQIQLTTKAE